MAMKVLCLDEVWRALINGVKIYNIKIEQLQKNIAEINFCQG